MFTHDVTLIYGQYVFAAPVPSVRTGVVKREYKDISLNNVITLGTRIRIVVMRVIIHTPLLYINGIKSEN
jgi:hypothetical protein